VLFFGIFLLLFRLFLLAPLEKAHSSAIFRSFLLFFVFLLFSVFFPLEIILPTHFSLMYSFISTVLQEYFSVENMNYWLKKQQ